MNVHELSPYGCEHSYSTLLSSMQVKFNQFAHPAEAYFQEIIGSESTFYWLEGGSRSQGLPVAGNDKKDK